MECKHRKQYLKPLQEGYQMICLDCNKILKDTSYNYMEGIASLCYSLAIGMIAMDIALKTLKELKI